MITRGLASVGAGSNSPRLGPGRRVYAVGDVHGQLDRLRRLHATIRTDLADRPVARPILVHIGDLIDRGPDSAGVLDLLQRGTPVPGAPMVNLMGNHEWMFLKAIVRQDEGSVDQWLGNGGLETLASWGIRASVPPERWRELVPRAHVAFLRGLAGLFWLDQYLFAHAGVRPGVPLAAQRWVDLLWIREPFLGARGIVLPDAPDVVVVHGHTPQEQPSIRAHRIGIDTGAGRGGPLTCVALEGDDVRFLQAGG